MNWQIVDRDTVLNRSGHDPYLVHEPGPAAIWLASEAGWGVLQPDEQQRVGATLFFADSPDAEQAQVTWDFLQRVVADRGWRLGWLGTEEQIDWPLEQEWLREGHWVWMSTTELIGAPDPHWGLTALADDADAEEINAFALPINPLFEGDPGLGKNRYWLGARDASGKLIGVGTVHDTDAGVGHLAGIVVDPAYRGQGLGRALVLGLSQQVLASDGVTTLSAYGDNHNAIGLYRSVGYSLDHAFHSRALEHRRPPTGAGCLG